MILKFISVLRYSFYDLVLIQVIAVEFEKIFSAVIVPVLLSLYFYYVMQRNQSLGFLF